MCLWSRTDDRLVLFRLESNATASGRKNCHCANDPSARHGPYHEWNRRLEGRLVHSIVEPWQAELLQQAIENYREVKRILKLWELETANLILNKSD